jgi:metal-responsive CopG/Arc/MetJ family transcriptional regulator
MIGKNSSYMGVRLPPELVERLDKIANQLYVTRSEFIRELLAVSLLSRDEIRAHMAARRRVMDYVQRNNGPGEGPAGAA